MTASPENPFSGAGEVTLVNGTLRGYRCWSMLHLPSHRAPHYFTSVYPSISPWYTIISGVRTRIEWPHSSLRAQCYGWPQSKHPELAPHAACGCGIYGWYQRDTLAEHPGTVMGVIEATGKTLLGTRGFRTERARIIAVTIASERTQNTSVNVHIRKQYLALLCELVRGRYPGVKVFNNETALLDAYPPDPATVENLGIKPASQ